MSSYSLCARPDASHGHPYLVFDCQGELHLPLIVFAKEALTHLALSSVNKYLTNILPFFCWLDTDPWQVRAHHRWTDPPEMIREVLREYLVSKLQCRVKPHQEGGEWLETVEEAVNAVRLLLAGLKLFYRIAKAHGYYQYTNPLIASFTETVEAAREHLVREDDGAMRPKLPDQSGVDAPHREGRLTDSYFLLKEKWIPQVVTDVVMSLTLGDWNRRGLKDTAWARNKGSRKRRAKYVRFSEQTVKLLKKYFDTERKKMDEQHYTLDDYLRLAEQRAIDLDTIPLFLSQHGTPWTVASFRAHYWKKACAAAKLDADIHQCRHWYVTQALIQIHERARKGEITVERGKEELIAYMHWRAGEKTLKAYNHFFQPTNHATVQDRVFKKLQGAQTKLSPTKRQRKAKQIPARSSPSGVQLSEQVKQSQDGTALYAFLIGTGGYTDGLIADLLAAD